MAGIYVHVPFCKSKCTYCDFASYPNEYGKAELYFACLYKEMKARANQYKNHRFDTLYIGGGTPSFVDEKYITGVVKQAKEKFNLFPDAEITVEINPGTLTEAKLDAYRKAGINRFSVGLQSADDRMLSRLNRIHTLKDYLDCAAMLKGENFNADALIGLFDQTSDDLKKTLDVIAESGATHVSMYALKAEDGTPMYTNYLNGELPDDDAVAELYAYGVDYLDTLGYKRYEVSNFSKPGFRSRHNESYWKRGEYIGLGVAASSHMENRRFNNIPYIDDYVKCIISGYFAEENSEVIEGDEIKNEFIMLALRTDDGIDRKEYKRLFGTDFTAEFSEELNKYAAVMDVSPRRVKIRPEYIFVQNSIIVDFLK